MTDEVKSYIKTKTDFIDMYYDIPAAAEAEAESYISDMNALGEQYATVEEFEAAFTNAGFYDRQYKLLEKLTPKSRKLTKEEKETAKQFKKDFYNSEEGRKFAEDTKKSVGSFLKAAAFSVAEQESHERVFDNVTGAKKKVFRDAGLIDEWTGRNRLVGNPQITDPFWDVEKNARNGISGFLKRKMNIEDYDTDESDEDNLS